VRLRAFVSAVMAKAASLAVPVIVPMIKVESVPVVGRVTLVGALVVSVREFVPLVANGPPSVSVFVPLLTPVPPREGLTGVFKFSVTFPLVPPPFSPVPDETPVIVLLPPPVEGGLMICWAEANPEPSSNTLAAAFTTTLSNLFIVTATPANGWSYTQCRH